MKELIIGIDGGTRSIFERMPMPFLKRCIDAYPGPELRIDLLSRGWAEQITGRYAEDTKAFYVFPKLDGTRDFIFKYSLEDMLSQDDVEPIWSLVNRSGSRVGVMNIPTTFPAPDVDGFLVSGAGGGLNKVEGVPPEMCYPRESSNLLEEIGYVVDIRLGTSGYDSIDSIFDDLEAMATKRTEAFLRLCREYEPDFGFLCYRHVSVIQYLGLSEILAYLREQDAFHGNALEDCSEVWKRRLSTFYSRFDSQLEQLLSELKPRHVLFTADHGNGPTYEYTNPNAFLQEMGYQPKRLRIDRSIRRSVKLRSPAAVRQINWAKTVAFSDWYSPCIYIHDQKRFGGPVGDSDIDSLVDRICQDYNSHPEAKRRGSSAEPFRRHRANSAHGDLVADIIIRHQDGTFQASKEGPFFRKNPKYCAIPVPPEKPTGMYSGNKSDVPFFCTDPETAKLIREEDPKDLTLVYKLTQRIFSAS